MFFLMNPIIISEFDLFDGIQFIFHLFPWTAQIKYSISLLLVSEKSVPRSMNQAFRVFDESIVLVQYASDLIFLKPLFLKTLLDACVPPIRRLANSVLVGSLQFEYPAFSGVSVISRIKFRAI